MAAVVAKGRPPLPLGTWGEIAVTNIGDARYKARARFRDSTGRTVTVARFGQTKGRAKRRLLEELSKRKEVTVSDVISPATPLAKLADLWVEREQERWTAGTRDIYLYAIANQVRPRLGQVRLSEAHQSVVHRALTAIRDANGPAVAKTTKSVLSGMFRVALAEGAINGNPALGAIRLPSKPAKGTVRALTVEEATALCDALRSDERATQLDLPDLVEWMLGTGCRIGEACATREAALDLEAGTWEINATMIRANGKGLFIQERPKTAAGWRVLALPPFTVAMVQRRLGEVRLHRPQGVIFGTAGRSALRDPHNTAGDLRPVLDRLGFDWVTSHVFRKTVATRLDEAGFSAREIADVLGHARPSLTQDVYLGRRVVSARAATVLDR